MSAGSNHKNSHETDDLGDALAALVFSKIKIWGIVLGFIISFFSVISIGGTLAYHFYLKPQADLVNTNARIDSLIVKIDAMEQNNKARLNDLRDQMNIILRRVK